MSDATYCYWSVADGYYSQMMKSCIRSARAVGVKEDFHVFSDTNIPGATCHPAGDFNKACYLFKLTFLKQIAELDYDYFVFLDCDNWFVRHPGNLLNLMKGSPIHVLFECDCTRESNERGDWWDCPLDEFVRLMTDLGVKSRSIFNVNGGFWIVKKSAVERVYDLARSFWYYARDEGYEFTEEAPLAYAAHMLIGNPYAHTLRTNRETWVSDWTGHYDDCLPDGKSWDYVDYLDFSLVRVSPAIVHCMKSKQAMIHAAQEV